MGIGESSSWLDACASSILAARLAVDKTRDVWLANDYILTARAHLPIGCRLHRVQSRWEVTRKRREPMATSLALDGHLLASAAGGAGSQDSQKRLMLYHECKSACCLQHALSHFRAGRMPDRERANSAVAKLVRALCEHWMAASEL